MGLVQNLRGEVQKNRKIGFKEKLLSPIMAKREEQREVEGYKQCMDIYAKIVDNPFNYTFDYMIMAEDALDSMIACAVHDQRKHRQYAKEALEQETFGVKVNKLWAK
jgi:hypothetical protein